LHKLLDNNCSTTRCPLLRVSLLLAHFISPMLALAKADTTKKSQEITILPLASTPSRPKFHPLNYPIHPDWIALFEELSPQSWFQSLLQEMEEVYTEQTIVPQAQFVWRVFELTSLHSLKGIILGQDPYPNLEHANGLAFSVNAGLTPPASLRNIFFELQRSHGLRVPNHGDLSAWASQGLLLLNTALCLDLSIKKPPLNIKDTLWANLTQSVVQYILKQQNDHPIFVLAMGKKAQKLARSFGLNESILLINTSHPSPLAAIGLHAKPFVGCGCFEQIDHFLDNHQIAPITWTLDEPCVQTDSPLH
jgi:uracil-DNA glycosylase